MKETKKRAIDGKVMTEFDFSQVGIKLEPSIVRVDNDEVLKKDMGLNFNKAMELAKRIRKMYKKQYGVSLKITTTSLAVELLGHYLVQEIFLWIKKVFGNLFIPGCLIKFCDRMIAHTSVIDCGEKHCDNNRFIWDWISIPIVTVQKLKRRYL